MIPEYLYRGDSDSNHARNLRQTFHHGIIHTNLINSGVGREIFENPILDLIDRHVGVDSSKSHFLSFSEKKDVALYYGNNGLAISEDELYPIYDNNASWNFLILTLSRERLNTVDELGSGAFSITYPNALREFDTTESKAFLINVAELLGSKNLNQLYEDSLVNAKRDAEWLFFPAMPKLFNHGQVEYSAIIDNQCFEVERYSLERQTVSWFI